MKRICLFFLLLPGISTVGAQTPDTLDYRNDYYSGRRETQEQTPVTPRNTVMLGNSLTERGRWDDYFEGFHILNRGIGGDCVAGMLARLDPIASGHPKAVFIMAGVNDLLFSAVTPEALRDRYARILDRIRKASPRTKVYIQSLLPVNETVGGKDSEWFLRGKNPRIETFNSLLRVLALERRLVYIDLWGRMAHDAQMPAEYTVDGIHLTDAGYSIWAEILKPYLKK